MFHILLAKAFYMVGNKLSGGYGIVVPTVCNNLKMFIDFNDGIDKSIFKHGFYDKGLTNFIMRTVGSDDVCVDVVLEG